VKNFLLTLAVLGAVALGAIAIDHTLPPLQTSGQPPPSSVTVAVDDEGVTQAAWTRTGEPIPLEQFRLMMMSAQAPNIDNVVRWMKGGMWVMPKVPGDGGMQPNATQLITRISTCQCDEDFPSIPAGYFKISPNPCTCPGVRLGDRCNVGVLKVSSDDGGSGFPLGAEIQGVARADNLVELQLYNQLGDAGALDAPDAGYVTTCISNAPLSP